MSSHPPSDTASCNLCAQALERPIHALTGGANFTSLNTIAEQTQYIRFCGHCGHVVTDALTDISAFYGEEYDLGLQHEDEDQLIRVEQGREIYRTDYQLDTLLQILPLAQGARVVDFGSGKAGTLKKLLAARPDLRAHAFDISDVYLPFWSRFLAEGQYACHTLPEAWKGSMDASLSFFMLEHVEDPVAILRSQWELLAEGGFVYGVIPYLYENPADMLIADHVNHFSHPSMRGALEKAGFTDIHIDTDINPQWMVFRARKTLAETQPSAPEAATLAALSEQSRAIAGYWQRMASQVEAFAAQIPAGEPVAIYGAGFYGSFIWQYWPQRERILCFVDRNPHVQERGHKGIPAVAAKDLPAQVQHILVGINPPAAKAAMAALDEWSSRSLQYHYLF